MSTADSLLPAASEHVERVLTTGVAVLTVLVVLLALGWVLYATALRVDRLHRQVLGSRATLEAQMTHRAQSAADLAACGALDPASALILSRAAHEALECDGLIVEDGLDPATRRAVAPTGAAPSALHGGAAGRPAGEESVRSRAVIESDLSRVLRTVLSEETRAALADDPIGTEALSRLDRTAYRMRLARSFHNTHVAEARRLRAQPVVRLLHLAGHAPLPGTVDIDDDTTPDPARPGEDS